MDLIGQLVSQLGVNNQQAEGVAGGVLGLVQSALTSKFGEGAGQQLQAQVPELAQWKANAPATSGSPGGLGGLLGGGGGGGLLGSALGAMGGGGGELAALTGLLGQFGLDAGKVAPLLPIVFSFLKSRLSPELLGQVSQALPFLSGGQQGTAGVLGGAMKGLFG